MNQFLQQTRDCHVTYLSDLVGFPHGGNYDVTVSPDILHGIVPRQLLDDSFSSPLQREVTVFARTTNSHARPPPPNSNLPYWKCCQGQGFETQSAQASKHVFLCQTHAVFGETFRDSETENRCRSRIQARVAGLGNLKSGPKLKGTTPVRSVASATIRCQLRKQKALGFVDPPPPDPGLIRSTHPSFPFISPQKRQERSNKFGFLDPNPQGIMPR